MKSFFKLIMMFFVLALFLLLKPSPLQAQPIDTTGYIKNIKTETVVLVSNNFLNGEISSAQEKNNQNFSGTTPLVLIYQNNQNLFCKNQALLNGRFIHNLSTNKPKVHQIRAP